MMAADAALQHGSDTVKLAWKDGVKLDISWSGSKTSNYYKLFKHHDSDGHKIHQVAFYKKKLEEIG